MVEAESYMAMFRVYRLEKGGVLLLISEVFVDGDAIFILGCLALVFGVFHGVLEVSEESFVISTDSHDLTVQFFVEGKQGIAAC